MNILMVHGIGQEGSTQAELLQKWIASVHKVAPGLFDDAQVEMAYYGTTLAHWTTGNADGVVPMGVEATAVDFGDAEELKFLITSLQEAAHSIGVDEAQIAQDTPGVVPMDSFFGRQLVGLVNAIEKLSPAKGALLLRVVKQAYTYLDAPGAGAAVDAIVRPLLQKGPDILITHSLGTVVAFKLLRQLEAKGTPVDIPLFITLGSPLGLEAFKKKLGPPAKKPQHVKRWMNFYDPSDLVALAKKLDKPIFEAGIENDGAVDNFTDNAHGIIGYLPHPGVIKALKEALGK